MQLLIADDHPVVLDGLEALLRGSGITSIQRCRDGAEVLAGLGEHGPDIQMEAEPDRLDGDPF